MLLEAAHRLDERRRDSQLPIFGADADATPTTHTGMPVSALSTAPELSVEEMQAPLMPPPTWEGAPEAPETIQTSRRWPVLAVLALVLVSVVVFLGLRPGTRSHEPDASLSRTTMVEVSGRDPSTLVEASRPKPPGAATPSPALGPGAETSTSAPPEPPQSSVPGRPAATVAAGATVPEAPPKASNSFVFAIHSKPPRARVTENGKFLGRTPLYLEIPRRSVARAPREFVVQLAGYLPYTVTQSDSEKNVRASLVLTPKSDDLTTDDAANDGFANEPSSPDGDRTKARQKPSNLEIRLRR
jgi:hypothetical protein